MKLLYIIWDVSPQIGSLPIRWYGLLFAMGFFLSYWALSYIYKKENIPLKKLDMFTVYIFVAVIVGARLGHCFFYEYDYYMAHPNEIIMVWQGGLASHGATIGIILAILLYVKIYKVNLWWLLDRAAIVIPISAAFVRFGNLMNSEIYGKVTSLPWGFKYIRDFKGQAESITNLVNQTPICHPTQLYEAFSYLITFGVLFFIYKKKNAKIPGGMLAGIMLIMLFTARFIIEFFKEVQEAFEKNMVLDMGQILSIPFIILGILFLVRSQMPKNKNIYPVEGKLENKVRE